MYPDPEFVKTRLWEQEQEVIHGHQSMPRGMGPRVEKELRDSGVRFAGIRQHNLISAVVRLLIQRPAARIQAALRPSGAHPQAHNRRSTDVIMTSGVSNIRH
jgi:hypothetical protein